MSDAPQVGQLVRWMKPGSVVFFVATVGEYDCSYDAWWVRAGGMNIDDPMRCMSVRQFRNPHTHLINLGDHYDALCTRFGIARVNAAIRNRILTNILRRELAGVCETASA